MFNKLKRQSWVWKEETGWQCRSLEWPSHYNLAKPENRFSVNSSGASWSLAPKFQPCTYLLFGMARGGIHLDFTSVFHRKNNDESLVNSPASLCSEAILPTPARDEWLRSIDSLSTLAGKGERRVANVNSYTCTCWTTSGWRKPAQLCYTCAWEVRRTCTATRHCRR